MFSGPSNRLTLANTPIFNGNAGSRMLKWLETSLWLLHYRVSDAFMKHMRTYNPNRTILHVCTIYESHCTPGAPIQDKNVSGGLLHLLTGKNVILD